MRLLVCGGRRFASLYPSRAEGGWLPPEVLAIRRQQKLFMFSVLDKIHTQHGITHLIEGDAPGADSVAGEWGHLTSGVEVLHFPAQWEKHKIPGRRNPAGPIRNQQMLDEGKPDRTVGFPGEIGTADMLTRSKRAGVDTWSISFPDGRWTHHL